MGIANRNPNQRKENTPAPTKLVVPWNVHLYVWIFMIALGVSPVLFVLGTEEGIQIGEVFGTIAGIVLIQGLLWIAQRRCCSEELTYWEGLLIAAASMTTGIAPISLALSFCVLLFTVAASFVFALTHEATHPMRHAGIRFGKLIIAIYRRRLYR